MLWFHAMTHGPVTKYAPKLGWKSYKPDDIVVWWFEIITQLFKQNKLGKNWTWGLTSAAHVICYSSQDKLLPNQDILLQKTLQHVCAAQDVLWDQIGTWPECPKIACHLSSIILGTCICKQNHQHECFSLGSVLGRALLGGRLGSSLGSFVIFPHVLLDLIYNLMPFINVLHVRTNPQTMAVQEIHVAAIILVDGIVGRLLVWSSWLARPDGWRGWGGLLGRIHLCVCISCVGSFRCNTWSHDIEFHFALFCNQLYKSAVCTLQFQKWPN